MTDGTLALNVRKTESTFTTHEVITSYLPHLSPHKASVAISIFATILEVVAGEPIAGCAGPFLVRPFLVVWGRGFLLLLHRA